MVEVALRDRKFTYCRPHIVNFLTTNDAFCHCLTLVDTLSVFTSKKVGTGGGGQVSAHRVSCTLQLHGLIGTGCTIGGRNLSLFKGTISQTVGSFQSGRAFAGQAALNIESLLISVRG